MDFNQIARELIPLLGGKENIASAAHCATRLRLVLVDDALADQQAIGKVDGVKGCFRNAGQMQVIFGTGVVNKVYAAFIQAAGIGESSKSEAANLAARKLNPFQRIARLLSNIFVPIIPAIVASGLLMGLLGMVKTYGWVNADNALYIMLDMCSSAAFIILPILIGFTAAREFGGNPYLGATLGGILTHPALTNAWGVASGFHTMNFFGLEIAMIGYQGTVFPVLLAVWFMSIVEKKPAPRDPGCVRPDPDAVPHRRHLRLYRLADYRPGGARSGGRYLLYSEHADRPRGLARRAAVRRTLLGDCDHRYSPQLPRD